jgi:hypothetical protein
MAESDLATQQRFLVELEQEIRNANRATINPVIPPVTKEKIIPLARSVAQLRARYLEAAFQMAERSQGEADVKSLRRYREIYEEARHAFEELQHAIERGYVDVVE